MLTTCPSCDTAFRITAEHLKPAQGKVRCGTCQHVFSALDYLTEERDYQSSEVEEQAVADTDDEVPVVSEPPELPEALQSPSRPSLWPRVLWAMGGLSMAAVLVTQYTLYDQTTVFNQYPSVQPYAETLCQYLDCEIDRPYDADAIKMLRRDVRGHPDVKGALLVNATIINTAEHVQAYPLLEVTLFDTSGTRTATRRLSPAEYLDRNVSIDGGMPAGQPVHVVLEVIGQTTRGAVSYEFEFISPKNRHGF